MSSHRLHVVVFCSAFTFAIASSGFARPQEGQTIPALGQPAEYESTASSADTPPAEEVGAIVANRPGFAESPEVVGRGVSQIEIGMVVDRNGYGPGAVTTLTAPLGLERVGLTDRAELQIGGEGGFARWEPSGHVRGGSDLDVGAKIKLLDQRHAGVNLAVAGIVNMPVGSSQFTSTGYDPGVKVAMARTFGNGVSLTTNLQAAAVTDAAGRFTQHAVSLTMSRALSATISGFAEVYRIGHPTRGETGAFSMAAGFARTVGSHMQLDLFAGRGLTDVACNWFVSAGFAVRRMPSGRP